MTTRIIDEFPNYLISDTGTVFSTNYKRKKGLIHALKQYVGDGGYLLVNFHTGKKSGYNRLVHRLVAKAFIPNPENLKEVNHKDGNKFNNCVENLEWVSPSQNCQHAWNTGLQKRKYGKDHFLSKPVVQIKDGEVVAEYDGTRDAQRKTGIKQTAISACCCHKKHCNTAGGFIWKYKTEQKETK